MKRLLFVVVLLIVGINLKTSAQGDLLITPKRVVFEGNNQKAELTLMNTGTDTATFSISFRNYKMTDDGKLKLVETSDTLQMFAEPYLRIFPRKVTLPPQEAQLVVLQCRRKIDMLPGEYRSHLWFRDEKDNRAQGVEKASLDMNQLSVSIIAIYGITIPVIVRAGIVNVSATISDLKLEVREDTIQNLKLTINRTGNISINGKLTVDYIPNKGKSCEIGLLNNVVVYTNLVKREVSVKLSKPPGVNLKNGKIKVRYTTPDKTKYMVYAEKDLDI